jgi:hypothetical protein
MNDFTISKASPFLRVLVVLNSARWISPDSADAVADLNLYVYVGNNPLKYIDPTGHVKKTPKAAIRIIMFITEGLGFVIQF